jgi:Fuc2NAc and GlcNAc transferase
MTLLAIAAALTAGLALSLVLTGLMRRYALQAQLLDRPNERSSHTVPTPRGGGVAIVATFLLLVTVLAALGQIGTPLWAALVASGLVVATLGFLDDRRPLPARWRFAGHLLAAAWVLAWLGPIPPVPILGVAVDLGAAGVALSALYLVWSINLFNFMDGIDGIASLEAIGVACGGAFIWWLVQPGAPWPVALLFAASVAGFLAWNFPPARIFMGDAGSGFLGLVVAVLALWSARENTHLFWAWFILGGCFMVDATTTLVRRVRRGERFNEAHRTHAYQYASRRHGSHKVVTLSVVAINTLWLLPLAVAVALHWLDGVAGVAIAFAPLVWLAFHYKAGDRAGQAT